MSLERKVEIYREGIVGSNSWYYRVVEVDDKGKKEEYSFQKKFGAEIATIHGKDLPKHYILKHWGGYNDYDHYDGSVLSVELADKIIRQNAYNHAKDHTENIDNITDMTEEKKIIRQDIERRTKEISRVLVFNP